LLEWHQTGQGQFYHFGHWVRDYPQIIKTVSPNNKTKITKIPANIWPDKNWKEWGYLIEI